MEPSASGTTDPTANLISGSVINRAGQQINQSSITGNVYFGAKELQAAPEPSSTVPFSRDRDFVGRGDILSQVHQKLNAPAARVALVGLGGVGKSQLAIEYSYLIQDESPNTWIFWVHASSAARLEQSYKTIADRVALPECDDNNQIPQRVYNWLCDKTNGQWLMILDNADDSSVFFGQPQQESSEHTKSSLLPQPALLATLLPQAQHGRILITSRDRETASWLTGHHNDIIEVQPMSSEQALVLLQKKLGNNFEHDYGLQLAQELDYMPLAISQAAAYINQRAPRSSMRQYIKTFQKSAESEKNILNRDYGDLRRDVTAKNSIFTTWQISFEQIRAERLSASRLLSLMSLFDRQGIPEYLLRKSVEECVPKSQSVELDEEFEDDIDVLRRYSLITISADKISFEMHRLVQLAIRRWLEAHNEMERYRQEYTEVLYLNFPRVIFKNWPKCRALFPHAQTLSSQRPALSESQAKWALALRNAGDYGNESGKYEAAEQMFRHALEGLEITRGKEHKDTLVTASYLSFTLRGQGKYEEAEQMARRALEGLESMLGKEHTATLMSKNNVAAVLSAQGKYDEAEQMFRQALKGYEKALGMKHNKALGVASSLALTLVVSGKYKEAERMSRRAVIERETQFGKDHANTHLAMDTLGLILYYRNKYEQAECILRKALEGHETNLGKEHPRTVECVFWLARTLKARQQKSTALDLYQRACQGYSKALGAGHPRTVGCHEEYASLLKDMETASHSV